MWKDYVNARATGEIHHGLPHEMKAWFAERGLDVNNVKYFFDLDFEHHRKQGEGVHSNTNSQNKNWNTEWKEYKASHPNATDMQIENQLRKMAKEYGVVEFWAFMLADN